MAKINGPVIDFLFFSWFSGFFCLQKTWREEFASIPVLWWRNLVPKWALENDSNLLEPGPFWAKWSNNPNWIAHHDQFPILLPPPWNRRSLRDSFSYVFLVQIQDRSSYNAHRVLVLDEGWMRPHLDRDQFQNSDKPPFHQTPKKKTIYNYLRIEKRATFPFHDENALCLFLLIR